jgi:hypothetical protein
VDLIGSEAVDMPGALNRAFGEVAQLQLRVQELELELLSLDDLKEKVARLERLQIQRQSIELAEPGEPIDKSKRS